MDQREISLVKLFILLALCARVACGASGPVYINEVLFNPPGGLDAPNEYIELRAVPNLEIPNGTYFLVIEGDTNGNPGVVQDIFELSEQRIGGNGFLVLLQKAHGYPTNSNAMRLVNTDTGAGWGSGSSSSIDHDGEGGATELENGSCTFMLVQTAIKPVIGADIDTDNNGIPDGAVWAAWTVMDSIGVLDNGGLGDMAYGAINFRRNTAAIAPSGTAVNVPFEPAYVGRAGNTTGSAAADWVASDELNGSAPNWSLGSGADTLPVAYAGRLLNHIGAPNFDAAVIPGVLIFPNTSNPMVSESGTNDFFTLGLNAAPAGSVTFLIAGDSQVEISIDNGATFGASRTIILSDVTPRSVQIRAVNDTTVEAARHRGTITSSITATTDAARYPLSTLVPAVRVDVMDNDVALLNEVKVNPPGTDEPFEFVELRGVPGALLSGVYLVVINGDVENDPGVAEMVVDLTGSSFGSQGLLLICGTNFPYGQPGGCTMVADAELNRIGGGIENGTASILLVTSLSSVNEGNDLDNVGSPGTELEFAL